MKTTVDVIELESLTYHEPKSDSEQELLPPQPATEQEGGQEDEDDIVKYTILDD